MKTMTKSEVKIDNKAANLVKKIAEKPAETAVVGQAFTPTDKPKEIKAPGVSVVCNINGINVGNECHIKCASNPKRPGSKAHMRYEAYAKATTVKEYLEMGGLKADLRYDHDKGFLELLEVIQDGKIVELKK